MARIRAIHPRAPQDEDVASMSIWARHLWDRLPCFADREGRLEDRPLMLKGEVFPADTVNVNELLEEFASRGFVIRYVAANGRRLIQIVSFHDYQRPDRKERDSVLEPPAGWTGDKRGKWVCDRTQGSAAANEGYSGNDPGGLADSDDESGVTPEETSSEPPIDRPRDRSGSPDLRLSGDPVERETLPSRDPAPRGRGTEPLAGEPTKRRPTGFDLLTMFGAVRAEVFPGTLPWNTARDAKGDAGAFAERLSPDEVDDLRATMRAALENIRNGAKGWNDPRMADPSFAFGAWKSGFHLLREKLHRRAPRPAGSLESRPEEKLVVVPKTDPEKRGWTTAKAATP